MNAPEINARALRFGCRTVELYRVLRKAGGAAWEIAPQFLRAGTSIGANLEEASGGQTKADFIAKVCIALKEAREARFWLRLISESHLLPAEAVRADLQESNELIAILVTIIRNARNSSGQRQA
jgi:four helix bundle protein